MTDYARLFSAIRDMGSAEGRTHSNGPEWSNRHAVSREWVNNLSASDWDKPIVPRLSGRVNMEDMVNWQPGQPIRVINPPPAYFWLGRDAEAAQ